MESQTLGKVKMTPRGEYREETTDVPLDIVSYGGGSYCVLKNVTGVTPTGDDVNYQLLAESGADGKSPQISTSKTWLVWDADAREYVDTGVSAAGEKGDDGDPGKAPIIGSNGNWYEWDETAGAYTDTGKPSRGEKGNTGAEGADGADGRDGITPTIGENGNWYLGETDTGKPSRGEDGATGATGATGEKGTDGKSAYAYAVEGGYTGTEAEFAAKLAEEMPDKLPNPNALTFTGAVTGSYDGSAPLSVEIPSGGGGGAVSTLKKVWSFDITETIADLKQIINFAGPVRRIVIIGKALEGSTSSASRAGIKFKQSGLEYAETLNISGVVGESGTPIYSSAVFDVFAGGYVCEFLTNRSSDFHTWNHLVTTHYYYVNPDRMAEWDAIWFNVWNVSSGSIEIWTDAEVLE